MASDRREKDKKRPTLGILVKSLMPKSSEILQLAKVGKNGVNTFCVRPNQMIAMITPAMTP